MIIRIVKMVFKRDTIPSFKAMMEMNSARIRAFDGCEYLQILPSNNEDRVVFTYSHWRDEAALEAYRYSDLFKELWPQAKARFAEQPEAWTVDRFIEIK